MNITKENTVGEIVVQNIKAAHVFKKHGIDFCCGGGISVEKACAKYNVAFSTLEEELNTIDQALPMYNYKSWTLEFLIDHIINIHHVYVNENIPIMFQYAEKVARVHGQNHPELVEIFKLVEAVVMELNAHLQKEEKVLFPYVKMLERAKNGNVKADQAHFGTVQNPIRMMEAEHDSAGDVFKSIAKLSNNYTPPQDACNTYRALFSKMEEFEQDLHQHIHLENNILFPKAIALEQELLA